MHLVQFTNNHETSVTQGDVLVIGHRKATISHRTGMSDPIIGAEVAEEAYDTRVCGIVYEVHAEATPDAIIPPEAEQQEEDEEGEGQARRRSKPTKAMRERQAAMQAYDLKHLEKLDRTKVKSGQLGYMVTHGVITACKVDADIAPIKTGDLLTTSSTKGHAQKVLEPSMAIGSIIGKALASLKEGRGTIPVLVMIQ